MFARLRWKFTARLGMCITHGYAATFQVQHAFAQSLHPKMQRSMLLLQMHADISIHPSPSCGTRACNGGALPALHLKQFVNAAIARYIPDNFAIGLHWHAA